MCKPISGRCTKKWKKKKVEETGKKWKKVEVFGNLLKWPKSLSTKHFRQITRHKTSVNKKNFHFLKSPQPVIARLEFIPQNCGKAISRKDVFIL